MLTLGMQLVVALCLLVFALCASRVAARVPKIDRFFRYGWALTAITFLVQGVNMTAHAAFAIVAYRAGSGSGPWNTILVLHPILNHSRTFLLTSFCLVLSVVLLRTRRGSPLPGLLTPLSVVVGGMLLGGVVGWQEEAFSGLTHYTAVAVWDIMELLALMVLLLVGLTTGGMDRGLWAALSVNAFVLALSVLWFAYLSRIDVGGQWSPRPHQIHLFKAVLYLIMIGIASRQWLRLRKGKPIRAFIDLKLSTPSPSLHG